MNKIFCIGDTHFGHSNILKYEPVHRPFKTISEHDEHLVRMWNSVVGPKDTVWHLGDVLFGKENFPVLRRLNGLKNLILGNHDHFDMNLYLQYFNKVVPYAKIQGCILSHIPVHPCQMGRYRGNIHGHMHSGKVEDPRYANVSCEHVNLTPVLLDKVVSGFPPMPPKIAEGAD